MGTVIENGMVVAVSGTAAYLGLTWMAELAVSMYAHLSTMLPSLGG